MKKKLRWMIPLALIICLLAAFLIYTGNYYHADAAALAALETDDAVAVTRTGYGWFFDGPSEDDVLVFYPGGKVEETAYAPMLRLLAEQGMDVCLVKMPFRLAVFGANRAEDVLAAVDHENRYVGGHSLGGAMAADYAAGHSAELRGVILFAAYPTKALDSDLLLLSIYGSEDGVLNLDKVAAGRQFAPTKYLEQVIDGGNHAQFGNYGVQKGDGAASISRQDQQTQTAALILQAIR